MTVPAAIRYLKGSAGESLRYHPPTSICASPLLRSSIQSPAAPLVSSSLTTIVSAATAGSSWPGAPRTNLLGLQLVELPQVEGLAWGSMMTSVDPSPSVVGYQALL